MSRWWVAAALLAVATRGEAQLPGQVQLPNPNAPPTVRDTLGRRPRAPGDTTTDSTRAPKELVKWTEPDSITAALTQRPGYIATRYQGNQATLVAPTRTLTLNGKGAVQREQTILVADTIVYNDSTHFFVARAPPEDTIFLRDPSQGTADLLARGYMEYDLRRHHGIVSELSTSSKQVGQSWYIVSHNAAVQGDTTANKHSTSFAMDAAITSCNLAVPHYHFESSDVKVVSRQYLVAAPAVLYVADVPVLWLPFIFQDTRQGRRSGFLAPRFGLQDIVRTGANFRREIDNVGYYFAINNYMDAMAALDWRSGNGGDSTDLGWTRINGEWRYRWLDRFLSGGIRVTYTDYSNGSTNLGLTWAHQQQFSQRSSLNLNLSYVSNTAAYQNEALTVAQALAAIASSLNYQIRLGSVSFAIGGSRQQYAGKPTVNQDFPTVSLTSQTVDITPWLHWTPSLSFDNATQNDLQLPVFTYQPGPGGNLDSSAVLGNTRNTSVSLQTPFRIGRFDLRVSGAASDQVQNYPQVVNTYDFHTGVQTGSRTYAQLYQSNVNWDVQFSLPSLLQRSWNISPFVSFVNADPSAYWVRTELSGGEWVHQTKTIQSGLSIAPTFYGFWPGIGPFSRFRNSIQTTLSYSYAPSANVSDEFLMALGRTRAGYLGGLTQNNVSFRLNTVIEGKLKSKSDTAPDAGQKIRVLTLNTSPLNYDFEVAKRTGRGLTTPTFNYSLQSDLLPGFDFSASYSLFQGDPISDTAQFKPFRTSLTASFSIGKGNNPLVTLSRIFGGATKPDSSVAGFTSAMQSGQGMGIYDQSAVAGPIAGRYPFGINQTKGWNLTLSYTNSQSRPVTGTNVSVLDPRQFCKQFTDPFQYQRCVNNPPPQDTVKSLLPGGTVYISPPQSTLRASTSFPLTPRWAFQWTTGYDFTLHEFSDQTLTMQREFHDWRAVFAFSRTPNGNFYFSFFVTLIAAPDLKFNYDRTSYRNAATTVP
ncbi:MAG TPA: putative LPS assembly protein LptD [Gemmatimonadaceae bacterium]|nr:putative LPS assembly protein LptD [Gemmatimonadaceae bacterium]